MITLLSPAKSLDFETEIKSDTHTDHVFPKETMQLVRLLKKHKAQDLKSLMSISDKLAELNKDRYKAFSKEYTEENSKPAIEAFTGDVYLGFDFPSLSKKKYTFTQKHIRILSGLYGVLKPFDKMQPYRLEMGTRLENKNGKNLYHFWGDKIKKHLEEELQDHKNDIIVNLASNEYFKSVVPKKLACQVIDVSFKEYKGDQLKFISFNAKKARGMMARYITDHRIDTPEGLKGFDYDGYYYNEELSTPEELLFVR